MECLSVLATVVAAFAASTAPIVNGQPELRGDMPAGQTGIRSAPRALEVRLAAVEPRVSGRFSGGAVSVGERSAPPGCRSGGPAHPRSG